MQTTRTACRETACHLHGIVTKHSLTGIIALQQPHALAAPQVDGGPEFHGQGLLMVARSNSIPADWLFSGWNCVANSRPRATAAQNGPP